MTTTSDQPSRLVPEALTVYNDNIEALDIARFYLSDELSQAFGFRSAPLRQGLADGLDKLSEHQLWRMLEATAYTYRVNGMFRMLSDPGLRWLDVSIPVDALVLTGLGAKRIDDIVRSRAVARSPVRFADYLQSYFDEHGRDDPLGLAGFRKRTVPKRIARVVVARHRGRLYLRDGSHRLLSLIMGGADTVRAYCAVPNGSASLPMAGDSTFVTLGRLYKEHADPADRDAIARVTELLARSSDDGSSALDLYWTQMGPSPAVRRRGKQLLEGLQTDR